MGLYPLRVKILQSGNITRLAPTPDEEETLEPQDITREVAPTTLAPPSPATPHHRSDIPPEEEFTVMNELESPNTYSGILPTSSSTPSSSPSPTVSFSVPSTTPSLPVPPRPPYTTVRVTNKWVEETLAKVKTVVDSILKSIGSARSNLDDKSSNKKVPDRDRANRDGEGNGRESIMERSKGAEGGHKEGEERNNKNEKRERGKKRNNEEQVKGRRARERGRKRKGIEIRKLDKKRSRERKRNGKSKGNRRRTKRRESKITSKSSADQKTYGREGERNGRGENTESARNEHNDRERRHHTRKRSGVISTPENKSFPNVDNKREKSEPSNNKLKQEMSRVSGYWEDNLSVAIPTPANLGFEGSLVEKGHVPGAWAGRERGGKGRTGKGKISAIYSEGFREGDGLSVPLSAASREESLAGWRGGRRVRDSDSLRSTEGSNDFSNDDVFTPKRLLDSEEVRVGSREKFLPMDNNESSGNENVSLGTSGAFSTKISSNVDSGKNGDEAGSGNGAPAPKQTISSVTDLLFTVPNERVIRPAQNSQVQSEIKSTEKLIRTSLEDLLFRVPPVDSRHAQEEGPDLKTTGEAELPYSITTTTPVTTALPRELLSPDDTVAPSVDTDTKIVTDRKPAYREGLKKRRRQGVGTRGELPLDSVYQRKNDTEEITKETSSLENEEETEKESQEEAGDLILRTACLPVGSIGRFKVEGVTYLVTGMGAGAGAEDCWREVTNVVNRHIRLPALNHTTLLATTAFYFVAASANLIGELRLPLVRRGQKLGDEGRNRLAGRVDITNCKTRKLVEKPEVRVLLGIKKNGDWN